MQCEWPQQQPQKIYDDDSIKRVLIFIQCTREKDSTTLGCRCEGNVASPHVKYIKKFYRAKKNANKFEYFLLFHLTVLQHFALLVTF